MKLVTFRIFIAEYTNRECANDEYKRTRLLRAKGFQRRNEATFEEKKNSEPRSHFHFPFSFATAVEIRDTSSTRSWLRSHNLSFKHCLARGLDRPANGEEFVRDFTRASKREMMRPKGSLRQSLRFHPFDSPSRLHKRYSSARSGLYAVSAQSLHRSDRPTTNEREDVIYCRIVGSCIATIYIASHRRSKRTRPNLKSYGDSSISFRFAKAAVPAGIDNGDSPQPRKGRKIANAIGRSSTTS